MKLEENGRIFIEHAVAPHAGAWIETSFPVLDVRGECVAPHAGAWIETLFQVAIPANSLVAPHAGAWIETAY